VIITDPVFSIVIPTFERRAELAHCLGSLASLDFPRDHFEVVVVDDGSASAPADIVAAFHSAMRITLLTRPHAGPAAARNTGARRARGTFLAFTDDDCVPAPGWLAKLSARLTTEPAAMVGGHTINRLVDNPYSAASQLVIDLVYAHHNADPDHAAFFASNNMTLGRDAFRALGGFDERFSESEDRDLCRRWLASGGRMRYAPEAVVYHAHPLRLRTFWRQHFNYGRGALRFYRAAGLRWSRELGLQGALYTHLPRLLPRMLAGMPARRMLGVLALLTIWQTANVAGVVWEATTRRS